MKTGSGIKKLSVVLALLMVIYIVPIEVYGQLGEVVKDFISSEPDVLIPGMPEGLPEEAVEEIEKKLKSSEVFEIDALREESVKHFRLADGTYQAVQYQEAVHRKDKNGKWQDIDNRLSLNTSQSISSYATQGSRVSFAEKAALGSELMTLSENGYKVSLVLNSNSYLNRDESFETGASKGIYAFSSGKISNHKIRENLIETTKKFIEGKTQQSFLQTKNWK